MKKATPKTLLVAAAILKTVRFLAVRCLLVLSTVDHQNGLGLSISTLGLIFFWLLMSEFKEREADRDVAFEGQADSEQSRSLKARSYYCRRITFSNKTLQAR